MPRRQCARWPTGADTQAGSGTLVREATHRDGSGGAGASTRSWAVDLQTDKISEARAIGAAFPSPGSRDATSAEMTVTGAGAGAVGAPASTPGRPATRLEPPR